MITESVGSQIDDFIVLLDFKVMRSHASLKRNGAAAGARLCWRHLSRT